jgi:thiol-disulfide isomerase/thioredoxin
MPRKLLITLAFLPLFASCKHGTIVTPTQDTPAVVSQDSVLMKDGMVLLQKDGQLSRLEQDVSLADGGKVQVSGMVTLADGTQLMLPEGMMMTMDGQLRLQDGTPGTPTAVPPPLQTSSSIAPAIPVAGESVYVPYEDSVLLSGKTKVLFFHAAWCPECKKADALLKTWLPSGDFSRSVYKVDYDTAKDLKVRYGVTYQHTFVLVDGNGQKLSAVQGPKAEQLRALLK